MGKEEWAGGGWVRVQGLTAKTPMAVKIPRLDGFVTADARALTTETGDSWYSIVAICIWKGYMWCSWERKKKGKRRLIEGSVCLSSSAGRESGCARCVRRPV